MSNHSDNPKKLYRSAKNRIIAGVAGGIGEYLGIDPTVIRILFVILIFPGGLGILLYLVLMFIVPMESEVKEKISEDKERIKEKAEDFAEEMKGRVHSIAEEFKERRYNHRAARNFFGLAVIIFGFIFLLGQVFPMMHFRWDIFWPSAIILLGFLILFN